MLFQYYYSVFIFADFLKYFRYFFQKSCFSALLYGIFLIFFALLQRIGHLGAYEPDKLMRTYGHQMLTR